MDPAVVVFIVVVVVVVAVGGGDTADAAAAANIAHGHGLRDYLVLCDYYLWWCARYESRVELAIAKIA